MATSAPCFDTPPYRLSGTVVGALLNDPAQIAALGDVVYRPPHKAPPVAPVLAVRPRHMQAADGDDVTVPAGCEALAVSASLGIVIGRTAKRVANAHALSYVAGYLVAAEIAVPLASHYRPGARSIARDGYCPIGANVVPALAVPEPDALEAQVAVDGVLRQRAGTGGRVRGVARLLADVTDFMTLQPGDVLLLGAAHGAPLVRAGQSVTVTIVGIGALHHRLVAEDARA